MVTSSLNVPRNKVPGTFLLVGVFEESVPVGVAYLKIAGWSDLVRKTHHLVLPLVSEHKAAFWIVSISTTDMRLIITLSKDYSLKEMILQRPILFALEGVINY